MTQVSFVYILRKRSLMVIVEKKSFLKISQPLNIFKFFFLFNNFNSI